MTKEKKQGVSIWDREDYNNQWYKAWDFDLEEEYRQWKYIMDEKYSFAKWKESFMLRYKASLGSLYDMRKYLYLENARIKTEKHMSQMRANELYEQSIRQTFRKKAKKLEAMYKEEKELFDILWAKDQFLEDCIYAVDTIIKREQNNQATPVKYYERESQS